MAEQNKSSKSKSYILDLDINSEKEQIKKERLPWPRRKMRCNFCGSKITLVNKARHEKSQKHKDGTYVTTERFEMII